MGQDRRMGLAFRDRLAGRWVAFKIISVQVLCTTSLAGDLLVSNSSMEDFHLRGRTTGERTVLP